MAINSSQPVENGAKLKEIEPESISLYLCFFAQFAVLPQSPLTFSNIEVFPLAKVLPHFLLTVKLCANKAREGDPCRRLESSSQEVRCEYVEDSVDCLLKLKAGSADFGVFTAEEALVAAQEGSGLQVVGEVRHKARVNEAFDFQTVAVVRSSHADGINGLRGKNYCHPGFSRAQYWTDPVLKVRPTYTDSYRHKRLYVGKEDFRTALSPLILLTFLSAKRPCSVPQQHKPKHCWFCCYS